MKITGETRKRRWFYFHRTQLHFKIAHARYACLCLCFGVTIVHANLCMYILASTFQDGGNPFPVTRLPVLNSMTDSSHDMLLLPALHSQWSRQV